ncbi:hypothetical protein NJB1604_02030 [Mycobacterium marinum]|uniref:DUF6338 family protein n=1 Tax=Mycobacterium marinum TaxID=1781 RepID=UPI0021C3C15A|nr:DUF6338 family protein [Mycobacterium marinum]GJO37370.1 hypothetical protein NJB1604_02030 [Mycobacterium marinum]
MIGTLQALLVAVVAVLPGAVYTIALENRGASWAWPKSNASSQIIRFLGASAAFHAVFAPLTYWAYRQLIVTRALSNGAEIAWYWWPILLGYLVVPYVWGEWTVRSRSWGKSSRWKRLIKGFVGLYTASAPEPRAWDWLFSKNPTGVVRIQLINGEWKAGLWGDSYASGYGEAGDMYISEQFALDDDGDLDLDDAGEMKSVGAGLLIRWSEVRYLEFSELPAEANDDIERSDDDGEARWWQRKPSWWRKPRWWRKPSWWRTPSCCRNARSPGHQ